jgi:hypothetical protein
VNWLRDGAVEIYLDHPELTIGAQSGPSELRLANSPAAVSESHILLRARAQIAPVKVTFWSSVNVVAGTRVADATLEFPEPYICVADVDGTVRYAKRIDGVGRHRVRVNVDDPAAASRIHVIVGEFAGATDAYRSGDSIIGSISPPLDAAESPAVELEFVLSEHDSPRQRLADAIRCVSARTPRSRALFIYDIRKIVEWLRWLSPSITLETAQSQGRVIADRLATEDGPISAEASARLAREIADALLPSSR